MAAKKWHAGRFQLPNEPPSVPDPVERYEVFTAEDFLDKLSPRGEYFGGSYLGGAWLYRGQSNADLPLIPAALRDSVRLYAGAGRWAGMQSTELSQIRAEAETLYQFLLIADLNGLP